MVRTGVPSLRLRAMAYVPFRMKGTGEDQRSSQDGFLQS